MAPAVDLFGLMIAALVIDCTGLGLRCWVRIQLLRFFGYDDVVLSLSLVSYMLLCAITFAALHYGYGVEPARPGHDSEKALQFFFISQLAYVLTSALVKTGVALVLFRINATERPIRHILIFSMAVVLTAIIVSFFLITFQCRPMSLSWGVGEGSCFDYSIIRKTYIAYSVVDITSNWFYSFLPVAMLYKHQMKGRLKLTAMFILGIGFVSSIATVVRFKYILIVPGRHETLDKVDELQNNLLVLLWSHIEIFLAILASSLVALRPLLRYGNEIIDQRRRKRAHRPSESL